jgi:hypothetical protein
MAVKRAGSARAPSLMTTIATIHGAHVVLGARQGFLDMFSHLMVTKSPVRGQTLNPCVSSSSAIYLQGDLGQVISLFFFFLWSCYIV